jgi:DUF971 family protein
MSEPFPTDLAYSKSARTLTVTFDTGDIISLPAELLRVESPSAEVQGHGPATKRTVTGKQDVRILRMEPVGSYAVRLVFDDGHDSGLYTWAYLRELAGMSATSTEDALRRS